MLGFSSKWPLYVADDGGNVSAIGYSLASNPLVVGLAFGIAVIIAAIAFGGVSGAHLNPAVTLGLWLGGRFPGRDVVPYILAQVIGGLFAGGAVYLFVASHPGVDDAQSVFSGAAIGFGDTLPRWLWARGSSRDRGDRHRIARARSAGRNRTQGTTPPWLRSRSVSASQRSSCSRCPCTNAGLNPARATATARFSGGPAIGQLWAFWVAPLVGAAIVGLLYRVFAPVEEIEIVEVIEVVEA